MSFINKCADFIATGAYVGKAPKAPGTLATAASLPLVWLINQAGAIPYLVITGIIVVLGLVASSIYEEVHKSHDDGSIVIDEVAGILITMAMLPMTWQAFVCGFLIFRFLDILKPFPIGYLDKKVPGGAGVMADDVLAGIIGNIILQLLLARTTLLGVQIETGW
ncbi:MAG: phosphatidylglycerophosphatase A [Pseudobdellovibrionaceae bacterium]